MTTNRLRNPNRRWKVSAILFLAPTLLVGTLLAAGPEAQSGQVLWQAPADLEQRDLLNGPGGKKDQPADGPFQFVEEKLGGTNPKFTATDASGVKWKVKLGAEARPETVATRFVWAVGYFADEDYFVQFAQLVGVPRSNLQRLNGWISKDSTITAARFEREFKAEKAHAQWAWRKNDFSGTRELNGLRILMATLNNWDLKDENNSVLRNKESGRKTFEVSDLGATFGTNSYVAGHERSRGNLHAYEHSRFITHKTSDRVDFATPGMPTWVLIFNPKQFIARTRLRWIGRQIPRVDAKWMGILLGRLSSAQIRDAFRSGGYSQEEVERYSQVVERRIAELNAL